MAKKSKPNMNVGTIDRDRDMEDKWKAEEALRTMKRYEEIKGDSKLMEAVKKLAKEQMDALKKVC